MRSVAGGEPLGIVPNLSFSPHSPTLFFLILLGGRGLFNRIRVAVYLGVELTAQKSEHNAGVPGLRHELSRREGGGGGDEIR